ncbi:MAG: hypothetical protein L3J63_02735 [Geopsychrobacter sp.]|nr:hypothetical protein [Geopsychrobacter sp.]
MNRPMKRLVLLFIPAFFLLSACMQPNYTWQHDTGLGEADFQQAQKLCSLYAEDQFPPASYDGNYPYYYDGYPFDYGGYRHFHRWPHHGYGYAYGGYYSQDYSSGINTYAYQEDLSRACLKGKGWSRIRIDEG